MGLATATALTLGLTLGSADAQSVNGPAKFQKPNRVAAKNINLLTGVSFADANANSPLKRTIDLAGYPSAPTFVDIDADGDLDMFVGTYAYNGYQDYPGKIKYYENIGSDSKPVFTERTGADNPLDLVSVNSNYSGGVAVPTFFDVNGDGALDVLVGGFYDGDGYAGEVLFYANVGDETSPVFTQTGNPFPGFGGIGGAASCATAIADIDNDGDFDVLIGGGDYGAYTYGQLIYYRNTGTPSAHSFVLDTLDGVTSVPKAPKPVFADIDNDGFARPVRGKSRRRN